MFVSSNGQTVSCITDTNDGTVTVRLAPARTEHGREERSVTLQEPSLREYAELRTMIVEAHDAVRAAHPEPEPPGVTPDAAQTPDGQRALLDYQQAVGAWTAARNKTIKSLTDDDGNERTPPYAGCVIAIVERLADQKVTVDDLVPEALFPRTCTALLEVWDAPLGGPGDLASNPLLRALAEAGTPAQPTAAPPSADPPAPDSPAPAESSPPGTESSPLPPQAPSTP